MKVKKDSAHDFVKIDPTTVFFTHSRIRGTFSGCGKRLVETLEEITSGQLKVEDLPVITVIHDGERYISLNNRRLWVLKQCHEKGFLEEGKVLVRMRYERTQSSKSSKQTVTYSLSAKLALK